MSPSIFYIFTKYTFVFSKRRLIPEFDMVRMTVEFSDENLRRLEVLVGFSTINGDRVSIQDLLNKAVESLFSEAYVSVSKRTKEGDYIRTVMESVLPMKGDDDRNTSSDYVRD